LVVNGNDFLNSQEWTDKKMTKLTSPMKAMVCILVFVLPGTAQEAIPPASSPAMAANRSGCLTDPAVCGASVQLSFESTKSLQASPPPAMDHLQSSQAGTGGTPELTLREAELMALKNHPRITIGELNALASRQAAREARAALLPTISANATGVATFRDGNRITAGLLNNPSVFQRAAGGVNATQLITDFGRTTNLNRAANLNAQAQEQTAVATREQVVFFVDQAFYDALSSDVLVKVAEQTVQARQVVANQIQALENAKLRSALDVSFANVAMAQAQLLLVNAKNNRDAAYANLSDALGLPNEKPFELVDTAPAQPPSADIDTVIQQALENRPDVKAVELQQNAAEHLATAEERLQLPDVSALGAAGITPVQETPGRLLTSTYGAVGVNIHIPVFNGFLLSARAAEARDRARAAAQAVRNLKDAVARDVRVAWLNVNSAFERENVAAQLLEQATLSLNLAQARYNLGLGSIVELSQAQLQQTEAEISTVTAKYQYEFAISALRYQTGVIVH
jgi:outer membrane protein